MQTVVKTSESIMLLIIAFYLCPFASPALAQNTSNNEKIILNAEKEAIKLYKEYEFLKEQTKEFREFIERERKQHQEFLQWSIYIAGIIFTVALGFFGSLGLKSVWDAKKRIQATLNEKFDEYINENTKKINLTVKHFADKAIKETLNLKKNICFLVPKALRDKVSNCEIDMLRKRGFENIELKNTSEPIDDKCDLVIFYYVEDDETQQENLTNLVTSLEKNLIPIIVYSKKCIENKKLKEYEWHLFANTPLTLVNWVFTTLNSFQSTR